jgi:hypothetical protein
VTDDHSEANMNVRIFTAVCVLLLGVASGVACGEDNLTAQEECMENAETPEDEDACVTDPVEQCVDIIFDFIEGDDGLGTTVGNLYDTTFEDGELIVEGICEDWYDRNYPDIPEPPGVP